MSNTLLEDIIFVYSGGSGNSDPLKSIGGSPSGNVLVGLSNNLFSNVKKSNYERGYTDYRCFYICNNSSTKNIYNFSIYLEEELGSIFDCEIGVSFFNDIQILGFNSLPNSGDFTLRYGNYVTRPISWNENSLVFQKNIQDQLNDLDALSNVIVEKFTEQNYIVSFTKKDGNRNHPLLSVEFNNLDPDVFISFSKRSQGQPINSIAPLVISPTTKPNGVLFKKTSSSNKTNIGTLNSGDVAPIWIKRTISGTISQDEINRFIFKATGDLFLDSDAEAF